MEKIRFIKGGRIYYIMADENKRVVIYTRVSTQEQSADGYSLGEQADRLQMYAKAHGWTVVRTYTDPGYSGAKLERPAIQQLIRDCRSRSFDAVLIYKLDRLSRSQKDTLHLIEDIFNPAGIGLISMNENFDTQTPFGKAMIGILSVFAQLERDQITERMTMGRIGRAKAGYYIGGSTAPVGYDYIPGDHGGVLRVNDYEAAQVRLIFDLFLHGIDGRPATFTGIRNYMHSHGYRTRYGEWVHTNTICRILEDQTYIGKVSFAGVLYDGIHEHIIDDVTWRAVQNKLTEYRSHCTAYTAFRGTHLLTGLMYCGVCGQRYRCKPSKSYRTHVDGTIHYSPVLRKVVCNSHTTSKIPTCSNRRYLEDDINDAVIGEIRKLQADPSLIRKAASSGSEDSGMHAAVIDRLKVLDEQADRLVDLYQIGTIDLDAVRKRSAAIEAEREKLEAELKASEVQPAAMSPEEAEAVLEDFDSVFSEGTLEEQRDLIKSLIDRIVIYPDRIEVRWNFSSR